MDHPAEFTEFAPAQPWRAAAMVAAGIATVELFILLLLAFVFGVRLFSGHTANATAAAIKRQEPAAAASGKETKAPPAQKSTTSAGPLPRAKTSVIVLNGNGVAGAAATASDHARSLHYVITASTNAPRSDFQRSLVMYRPGFKPAARRLARDMRIKHVTPLDGVRKGDLQGAQLALIIGG